MILGRVGYGLGTRDLPIPNAVRGIMGEVAELESRPVDARALRRAQDIFRAESTKSFVLDLGDLSRDAWSLLPSPGDFLAEIRTKRFDTLTYAKSSSEAEDISLFDRRRHRNIAIYASKQRMASRGRCRRSLREVRASHPGFWNGCSPSPGRRPTVAPTSASPYRPSSTRLSTRLACFRL